MRKAALASVLTLLLSLSIVPTVMGGAAFAVSSHDAYIPYATDFIFPVGNPRISPTFGSRDPNGYEISQMFNNSCDPALGQGYYFAGQYFCGHTGVDLTNFDAGGPIHATAAGIVVYAGYNSSYGEMIRIKHLLPNGAVIYSQYEHLMYGSIQVGYGQIVIMGQTIGSVGATGFVTGAHLHFEIKSVDDPGVGYTFGNAALIMGYYEPISFVASHSLQLLPTATPAATSTPSSQVLALSASATATPAATGSTTITTGSSASTTGEHEAVLADFLKRYHSYVTVSADHLNVRSGSDFSFTPLNSVQRGAKLGFLGMTGNGWVHVALPSNVYGYVARQWVSGKVLPKLPPIEASIVLKPPFSYVTDTRYPARNGPHMHSAAIEVLKRGERLTYLGTLGSWDKVILPSGREGWVLNWYVRDPQQRIDLSPPKPAAPKPVTIACPCVVTTVDGLRLRAGPALSAPVIEGLPIGAKLALHSYHTSWVAVTAPDGHNGYVMRIFVRTEGLVAQTAAPAVTSSSAVTSTQGNTPVSSTSATTATTTAATTATTTTVAPNTTANTAATTTTATTATTGTLTTDTAPRASDADAPPAAGYVAPFVWVNVGHANVRAAPNLKSVVFISEPRDTEMARLGTHGEWTHVETRHGITGWVMTALIRSSQ